MSVLQIKTAEVFQPLLEPADWKGAHGGRGSGKTHFFGELAIDEALRFPGDFGEGLRLICIREVQKDLSQSSKLIIEDKIAKHSLGAKDGFKIWKDRIETPKDGIIIFKGMNDYSAESAKSLERFKRAWIDEAQTLSARSLSLLGPTIHRWPGSEIWASWNPRRKSDAIDDFFRVKKPKGSICVNANWRDNPFWNESAEKQRLLELEHYPERYDHTYEGGYAKAFEGAYFSGLLLAARQQKRIGHVSADPLLPLRAFHDLGGSSANADAYVIWIVQWVGQEIRVLDYYESVGQVLAHHVNWMRTGGYSDAINYLPHDGVKGDDFIGKKYEDHWRDAGFKVEPPVKNQGPGAASMRVEAVRRLGPKFWFNEATTEPGRDALGFYHERKDEIRNVGLGPDHDWSSHCFTGDTEVLTRYGTYPIRNLPKSGEVLTPCGWKRYRNPRITRRNAPLVEVAFADGLTVKCTPDHLFATVNGWKSAQSLRPGLVIQSTLTPARDILTVFSTVFGRVKHISLAGAGGFIGKLGLALSEQYQRDVTSTTGMMTRPTICLATSNVSLLSSTYQRLGSATESGARLKAISPSRRRMPLEIGTSRKPEGFGIAGTPSEQKAGQSGSASRAIVRTVTRPLMLSFESLGILRSTARRLARWLRIAAGSFTTNGPPTIASVRELNEKDDVWCLTVPDAECFSLSNGAVVHNCADAFGLMAISYEEPGRAANFNRPIRYANQGYA